MRSCQYCGLELDEAMKTGSLFCNDFHRTKYHNALKKLKREHFNAIRSILFIQENLPKEGDLGKEAFNVMKEVLAVASVTDFIITCSNCGQRRFYMPLPSDTCDFCHKNEWLFKAKQP